jgi:hypothetical protein
VNVLGNFRPANFAVLYKQYPGGLLQSIGVEAGLDFLYGCSVSSISVSQGRVSSATFPETSIVGGCHVGGLLCIVRAENGRWKMLQQPLHIF